MVLYIPDGCLGFRLATVYKAYVRETSPLKTAENKIIFIEKHTPLPPDEI